MLRGLTAKEFSEWFAYAQIDPFNELRADYRAAAIERTVFNVAVEAKHRHKLEDFLLRFGQEPEKTEAQLEQEALERRANNLRVIRAIAAAHGIGEA